MIWAWKRIWRAGLFAGFIAIAMVLMPMSALADAFRIAKIGDRVGSLVVGLTDEVNVAGSLQASQVCGFNVEYHDYNIPGNSGDEFAVFIVLSAAQNTTVNAVIVAFDTTDLSVIAGQYIAKNGIIRRVFVGNSTGPQTLQDACAILAQ